MKKKNKTINEFLLVNLEKSFLDGSWEEVKQPQNLKKYNKYIIETPFNYDKTTDIIRKIGFVSGYGGKNVDGSWGVVLLDEILKEDRKLPVVHIAKLVGESRAIWN